MTFTPEMIDGVRYGHLLFIAMGLGAAFLADVQVLSNLSRPVTRVLVQQIYLYHRVVWAALFGMWVTGLALVYIRTGFVIEAFTPKLIAKLAVVGLLTFNAMVISWFALPTLCRSFGWAPNNMPLKTKILGGWVSSLSSASWLVALALGGSTVLKTANFDLLLLLIPAVYGAMFAGATVVVLFLHAITRNQRKAVEKECAEVLWLTEKVAA